MKSLLYSVFFYLIFFSCAQKVPPVGGKKDIIHPKLISSIPKNQALNFDGKIIELYFDEYVKVENINQNLIITPSIEGVYSSKVKPTGVRLTFDKSFKPNTTYNLNFRSTFKDITESNEAKNIRLVFSTGSQIDSLKISGTVINPQINKPVFDALVGLYKFTDTLNIKKEKPYYFTKTDSLGKFNIENIQANKYKIYAISDYNNNTIFNEAAEKIGYILDTLNLNKNTEKINLLLVKQDKLPLKIARTRTSVNYANIELNKGIESAKIIYLNASDSLPYIHSAANEVKIFNTKSLSDTVKYELVAIDSVGKEFNLKQKFIFKKAVKKTDSAKDQFQMTIDPSNSKAIENNTTYKLTFSKPILNFDQSKIKILNDTLTQVALLDSNFKWNNDKNILIISAKTKSKNVTRFSIDDNTFFSVENDTLKKFRQDNKILLADDTGIISGEISAAKGNEIIQLLNEKLDVVAEIKYIKNYFFRNVLPGKYYVRLISDDNKNGKWDAGDYEKGIIPEKIQFINNLIQIKANFELSGYNFTIQ